VIGENNKDLIGESLHRNSLNTKRFNRWWKSERGAGGDLALPPKKVRQIPFFFSFVESKPSAHIMIIILAPPLTF